ncbi:MAG: MCT family MFS transporter [Alphaproteobacteria bacterium]
MTTKDQAARQNTSIFYGWIVVGAAFVVMFLGFGVAYSFGAFFKALQDEFRADRADISLVFSLSIFLMFLVGALAGPAADRLGPRRVIAAGMVLIGLGLLIASRATALWHLYIIYGLTIGLGVGFSYVPAVGTVQRWFVRRRGLASGLAVSGIGAGTLIGPFAAAWLIGLFDWRGAYVTMAGFCVVLGLAGAWLIEHSPERRGLAPDGDPPHADTHASAGAPADTGLAAALRSPPFMLYALATFLTALGLFTPLVHLPNYARDHGLGEETGVMLLGLFGLGSLVGRFLLGAIADRYGRHPTLAATFAIMGAMSVLWWVSTETWSLGIFAVVFGTCYGGYVALSPALMMDYFGGRNVSGIIGILYSAAAVGALAGPTLSGLAYDLMGSYTLPILAGAVFNLAAAGVMLATPTPKHWRAGQAKLASAS